MQKAMSNQRPAQSTATRVMRYLFLLASALAIPSALIVVAILVHPPTVGILLSIVGRREVCSLTAAASGAGRKYTIASEQARIAPLCKSLRSDGALTLWNTPDGDFWLPSDSGPVLPVLLAQQHAEVYGDIKTGEVVLDGGAHVGVYTRRALAAGARLVVAIEPAPDNIECLRRNFKDEIAAGRVIVYPKGVWDRDDELVFHTVAGNSAGDSFVLKNGPGKELRLPLTTIDKLTAELQLPTVDRIKLDIKGAERQALRGAAAVIARYRPRLAVASEHHPDDYVVLPALIRELHPGYSIDCGSCFGRDYRLYPETLLAR
jgi:FkbM family methyltransferase